MFEGGRILCDCDFVMVMEHCMFGLQHDPSVYARFCPGDAEHELHLFTSLYQTWRVSVLFMLLSAYLCTIAPSVVRGVQRGGGARTGGLVYRSL